MKMKLLNTYNLIALTIFVTLTNSVHTETTTTPDFARVIAKWDEKDIQQFLKDRNVKYDVPTATEKGKEAYSVDQLKAIAAAEVGKLYDASNKYESIFADQTDSFKDNLIDLKETVLSYVWPKHVSEKVSRSYAHLTDQYNPSALFSGSQELSDWIFETWSQAQLQATLKQNKIKYKSNATKDDLIALAKKNYNKIASNSKSTGKYPGDWLFEAWSTKDLQKWLHDHNISISKRSSGDRSYLLKQVRESIYPASVALRDSKDELFDSLNDHGDLSDQASGIKDDFIHKWSESQLYEWLKYHGVEVSSKAKHDKEALIKFVKENKASLKSDIDEWFVYAKNRANFAKAKADEASESIKGSTKESLDKVPSKEDILEKVPSKEDADNLVNDTFVLDVEKWPRDRLKSFLTSRGVSIPLFATRKDLVKLVKKYKSRRLIDFSKIKPEVLFEGWSTDQIKGWLQTNKIETEGYRDELVNKAYDLFNHLQKENFYKEQALDAAVTAKDTAVDYSSKGKDFVEKVYDDYKEPVGDFLNAAKDKAYDAAISTKNYGSDFFDYLSSWSNEDLQRYLETFGVKNTKGLDHEQLITKAKKNTLLYFNGDGGWFSKPVEKKSVFSTGYWRDLITSITGY